MGKTLDRLKNKRWLPVFMSQRNMEKVLGERVEEAVMKERTWRLAGELGFTNEELRGLIDTSYVLESQGGTRAGSARLRRLKVGEHKDIREVTTEESMFLVGAATGDSLSRSWSESSLRLAQDASFNAFHRWAHARSAVLNLQRYVFGRGLKFDSPSPEIVDCLIKKFWFSKDRISIEQKQKDMFRVKYLDGELFLAMFIDRDGYFKSRIFPSPEITGIETNPGDIEEIWSYKREWFDSSYKEHGEFYPDANYDLLEKNAGASSGYKGKFEKNVWFYYTKYGELNEKRGRPQLYSVLRYLRLLQDMIGDRSILQHELSRIFLKKKIKGGRSSEETTRIERPPRGGYMLIETNNVEYSFLSADTKAGDAKIDMNNLKYAIAAGVGIPFFILDQNPENANYASILEASTPFVMTVLDEQDSWRMDFDNIFRFVLRKNIEFGQLPEEITIETYGQEKIGEATRRLLQLYEGDTNTEIMLHEIKETLGKKYTQKMKTIDAPISINFPDVARSDELQLAQVLKIYGELGLASVETLSEKAGFNFKEELFRIAMSKKRAQEEAELELERYKKNESMDLPKNE